MDRGEHSRRAATRLMTCDEARRIAAQHRQARAAAHGYLAGDPHDGFDMLRQQPAQLGIGLLERRHHFPALRGAAEAGERIDLGDFAAAARRPPGHRKRTAPDVEQPRHFMQRACGNAVGALLVLLDLLKGDPEGFRHLRLALAGLQAGGAQSGADVLVDGAGHVWALGKYPLAAVKLYHDRPVRRRGGLHAAAGAVAGRPE